MDNLRAKEILERWLEIDRHYYDKEPESDFDKFVSEQDEAVEMAIIALEKSIPRKPDEPPSFYDTCLCPRCCACLVKSYKHNYCQKCGQALDWRIEK